MKKNYSRVLYAIQLPKFSLKMKLSVILLIVSLLKIQANSYSQNTKLTLDLDNASVEQVINEIESVSEFRFLFESDLINLNRKVSLKVDKAAIKQILNILFKDTNVKYKTRKRQILLTKKRPPTLVTKQLANKTNKEKAFQLQVSGKITDSNGQPLLGAAVLEKGTTNGAQTDFDGAFSIDVSSDNATLVVSFLGFKTQEIVLNGQTNISIVLEEDTAALDEVVVVGYGTQKKVNLTGAVGVVESEVLENKPIVNVQEVLQGKVPGLIVSNTSGRPGSGANIDIRGASSIGGDSGVLFIIDGAIGNIFTVNPNDIESVSVLKDAASAAIYGARAANGVVIITTKSAKGASGLKVDLRTSLGIQEPQFFIDFVGARDYMELFNLASANDGFAEPFDASDFAALENGDIPDNQWYREIYNKTALIKNNYLSLTTGNDKFSSRVGIGYDKQEGLVPKDDYERLVVHPKLTYNIADWLTFDGNIQYTRTSIEQPQGGSGGALTASLRLTPIAPIRTTDGQNWFGGSIQTPGGNPIAAIAEGGLTEQRFTEINTILSFNINPIEGLNIKPFYAHFNTEVAQRSYTRPLTLYNNDGTVFSEQPLANQSITERFNRTARETLQLSVDYSFTLNEDHNFSLFALASQEEFKGNGFGASVLSPAFENIYTLSIGVGTENVFSGANDYFNEAIASYVGRLNYNYKEKYLFEASIRHDGTSRFQEGYRWGTFPSFSGGWNVHKENFFADNVNFVSQLKLRASWGELGDALKIGRYATRNILGFTSGVYGFNGSQLVGGAFARASFIDNLTWETSRAKNFGIDLGFFKQKLTLSADYFIEDRFDILYAPPVPIELGQAPPITNQLEMQNKGFEIVASYRDNVGDDFTYNVDFNIGYSKNKIVNIVGEEQFIQGNGVSRVGTILNAPFGIQSDGLFQNQTEIDNAAIPGTNVRPGNIRYVDQNDDGLINGDDRVILNQERPYNYGFNLGANYKNFSLSANFYGRFNNYRYLQGYEGWAFYLSQNARPIHLDSWTPDNPDATYPRLSTTTVANDQQFSDFWLRKANFLKLQSLSLAYKLPQQFIDVVGFDNASVSFTGQNLAIFSNYEGFDPEGGQYTLPRTYTLGLQLTF